MRRRSIAVSIIAVPVLSISGGTAAALDTQTFSYDALGRLVAVQKSGGSTNSICYDPAGNRSRYKTDSGGTAAPCIGTPVTPSTPAPTPTPKNPTLYVTTSTTTTITLATLANYTGAAAITSFTPQSGGGSAVIASGGQSVNYTAPYLAQPGMCQPAYSLSYTVTYTVQNTPGGASASGTAIISVSSLPGEQPGPWEGCP
jgi:YD repeat-containing protein